MRIHFNDRWIHPISYRPMDVRFTYNVREYIDFPKPELQAVWGAGNVALFAPKDGVGAGPGAWSHSMLPDQHAFRGSYGGWVFPLFNHAGESAGHYLIPTLLPGLAAAYGRPVAPQEAFDAMLALLSATAYTTRFGRDLEDDFPHVPFPADGEVFDHAVRIGARLRSLQGFAAPNQEFRIARLAGHASAPALDVPTPRAAWHPEDGGTVNLLPDRSLRLVGVPERSWRFSVSGYAVLYRWLRARNGDAIDRELQRGILDVAGRIAEMIHLCDQADAVLDAALANSLGRQVLGLPARADRPALEDHE